ncbi:MAG: ATP-binding protein [Desulfurococcales archaeon]|nr:ATP-binding protein [Desulfurococcales archaeon]
MVLVVDQDYRTMLGTAFYDRADEVNALRRALRAGGRLVVVYGPRNVGKSELARYLLKKDGLPAVRVDARLLSVRGLEAEIGVEALGTAPARLAREAAEALLQVIGAPAGLFDVALRLAGILAHKGEALLLVDEFHELPRYRGSRGRRYGEALDDLRSLAAYLAKADRGLRVVVTVSEGFAATRDARSRLEGYSTRWLLVEHMDRGHFEALYREYAESRPCNLAFHEVYALVGGTPGALPDLCPLSSGEVVGERIPAWLGEVEAALSAARSTLRERGFERRPGDVIREALGLLERPVKPLREPERFMLGEVLVEQNIVYPVYPGRARVQGLLYRPQYPVYHAILAEAVERGVESLLELDPARVYERALESLGGGG